MGFEGADGKEGLIRGMKGEREREREKGKSGGRRQRRPPSSSSKNDVFIGVDLGQRSRLLYRPAVVFSGRAGSFFCVLLIGQSSKVVVCRPIVSECVLTFRLLPALRWRDRNSIELATRGSPASVSSSRLCYYTASHDRNNIVSHGRRSPGDGVRDFLRQLG